MNSSFINNFSEFIVVYSLKHEPDVLVKLPVQKRIRNYL